MGRGETVAIISVVLTFLMVLSLALPITELVYAHKYRNDDSHPECLNTRLMNPVTWLLVSGVVSLITIVLLLFMSLASILAESAGLGILTLVLNIFAVGFNLSWAIVGSVVVFRDNPHCEPEDLKGILYASVIIHLVGIFYSCCLSITSVKANSNRY